ncbi:MAG: acyltransferase domain-containing protein [Chloroflexia bacterium]|nr:acyltransferase domain-containing protein [Chloroflexia bacterium]
MVTYYRSKLQQSLSGTGKMLAVGLSKENVEPYIKDYKKTVSVAAINSFDSLTLAGNENDLDAIAEVLVKEEIFCKKLHVEIPFHSPYMDPIKEELITRLVSLAPNNARVSLYSTVYGKQVNGTELNNEYWWLNVREPFILPNRLMDWLKMGTIHLLK